MPRPWIVLLVAMAIGSAASHARPQDAPAAKPAPTAEAVALTNRLRARVVEWCDARKLLTQAVCETCRGWGRVEEKTGRIVTCPTCDGRKLSLRRAPFRKVAYDMKSPAWRSQSRAKEVAGEAYDAANRSSTAPGFLRSYRIDRVELLDATHGVAWVFEGTDTVPRDSRWLVAIEPATKAATWFLYDEATDGEWPREPAPAVAPPVPPEPLPQLLGIAVQAALETFAGAHVPDARSREGRRLVLALRHRGAPAPARIATEVRADAVVLMRTIFRRMPDDWDAVRLEFTALWQDKFGAREWRPTWVVALDAETYRRIHFDNLDEQAVFALFDAKPVEHEGWRLVEKP